MSGANPVFCACDMADRDAAAVLARAVAPHIGGIKLGLEFFCHAGPDGVRLLQDAAPAVFLDLKLHDIPNTVAGAVSSVAALKPDLLTIHTSGGRAMMQAAVDAADRAADRSGHRTRLLGVSVLTSLDEDDLGDIGIARPLDVQVAALAELAQVSGLDGLVCSPREIELVREACGEDFLIVTPGIRPEGSAPSDQKRTLSPAEAIAAGADILVIGRPITQAEDPAAKAETIITSLQ